MPTSWALRGRRTITALSTLERPTASLDAHSSIALEWAAHHIHAHQRLKPQPAVLIRRALCLYVAHLGRLEEPEQLKAEAVALDTAARGSGTAITLTEARARLEAAQGRAVPFREVRFSAQQIKDQDELVAALERHMEAAQ
jgi:hypothetical protein